jgi:hypothetical protein
VPGRIQHRSVWAAHELRRRRRESTIFSRRYSCPRRTSSCWRMIASPRLRPRQGSQRWPATAISPRMRPGRARVRIAFSGVNRARKEDGRHREGGVQGGGRAVREVDGYPHVAERLHVTLLSAAPAEPRRRCSSPPLRARSAPDSTRAAPPAGPWTRETSGRRDSGRGRR